MAQPQTDPYERFDLVDCIIEYETGAMDAEREKAFFEHLCKDGTIYHLQGSYQRRARELGVLL